MNACTLWLYLLSVVSLRQLQACEFFECFNNEHSRCSALCEGGRWLDLKKANAKATQHENYMGAPYAAEKAIDRDPKSCAMSRVCTCATLHLYVKSRAHAPKPNRSPPCCEICADQPKMDSGSSESVPNCCRSNHVATNEKPGRLLFDQREVLYLTSRTQILFLT